MKFLRYFLLGTLILQSFGLTAMSSQQKAEVTKQITTSFGNDASWFGDSKNVEGLKALINKLGTVEKGSQKNYLKLLDLKIETAQALKKSSSSTNTASVEIKIKTESNSSSSSSSNSKPQETLITYADALKMVNKAVIESDANHKAQDELYKLAINAQESKLRSDGKTIDMKQSAVDAIIAKYASVETKRTKEKQSYSDKVPSDGLIAYYEAFKTIITAIAKADLKDSNKVQEAAIDDLKEISKSKRTVTKNDITYLYQDDIQAVIDFHIALNQPQDNQEQKVEIENEGIVSGTLVVTPNGLVAVEKLKKGDFVTAFDINKNQKIKCKIEDLYQKKVKQYVSITIDNQIINVAAEHIFYLPIERTWIRAKNLKKNDIVFNADDKLAIIKATAITNNSTEVYVLIIENMHNFIISNKNILVHNLGFVAAPAIISSAGPIGAIIALGIWAVIGTRYMWHYFKKKQVRDQAYSSNTSNNNSSGSKKPDDEEDKKKKQPNGEYTDAGYHHINSSGKKSPSPKNGQKALDCSIQIKQTSSGRIGISNGEFVVLRETTKGVYHGYVVNTWNELEPLMQQALRRAGYTNANGKVINSLLL